MRFKLGWNAGGVPAPRTGCNYPSLDRVRIAPFSALTSARSRCPVHLRACRYCRSSPRLSPAVSSRPVIVVAPSAPRPALRLLPRPPARRALLSDVGPRHACLGPLLPAGPMLRFCCVVTGTTRGSRSDPIRMVEVVTQRPIKVVEAVTPLWAALWTVYPPPPREVGARIPAVHRADQHARRNPRVAPVERAPKRGLMPWILI